MLGLPPWNGQRTTGSLGIKPVYVDIEQITTLTYNDTLVKHMVDHRPWNYKRNSTCSVKPKRFILFDIAFGNIVWHCLWNVKVFKIKIIL